MGTMPTAIDLTEENREFYTSSVLFVTFVVKKSNRS
mgnify:CR=1 FL=1